MRDFFFFHSLFSPLALSIHFWAWGGATGIDQANEPIVRFLALFFFTFGVKFYYIFRTVHSFLNSARSYFRVSYCVFMYFLITALYTFCLHQIL